MALNDFLGLGKILPIDKLIEILSSSVGRLSKSYFDKKDADTKAYEIKKIAEAKAEELKIMSTAIKENFQITGGIEYKDEKLQIQSPENRNTSSENLTQDDVFGLDVRTENRVKFREAKKQLNIENITAIAANDLKDEPEIENNPIDEDWTNRFFNIAEDISSEEMQFLWGKILAGEIKSPKSYSLRALDILRNLTKEEADVFIKFAQAKLVSGDKFFIYNQDNGILLEKLFGITFSDRLLLTELGLIASENNLELSFSQTNQKKETVVITYGEKAIAIDRNENTPKQAIRVLIFTKVGIELSKLIAQNINEEYIRSVSESLLTSTVRIEYGDLIKFPDGKSVLTNTVVFT